MPSFRPFVGTLYDRGRIPDFASVCAPPYDVIDDQERDRLAALHPNNAVHLILAKPRDGKDKYQLAADRIRRWVEQGILADDPAPAFYLYSMGYRDELGRPHQTTGVIGALAIDDTTGILPHEETLSKPLGDQLSLMEATAANLSPIYLLSPAEGLSSLLEPPGPPIVRCTDTDGVHHRLWRLDAGGVLNTISEVICSEPLIIADGHHRYETACQYRTRQPGRAADWIMALVVELSEEQLWVRPTHRMFLDADPDDVAAAFHAINATVDPIIGAFDSIEAAILDGRTVLIGQGSPPAGLVGDRWAAENLEGSELLDSLPVSRIRNELLPNLQVEGRIAFEPDTSKVIAAVESGDATCALLVPPVTVTSIRRIAEAGLKMPQKTTYFAPKPRTGAVYRRLEADTPTSSE